MPLVGWRGRDPVPAGSHSTAPRHREEGPAQTGHVRACLPRSAADSAGAAPSPGSVDTMRLILIRHGQTSSNVAGLLDTRIPGPGLTALGRTQASRLPAALRDEDIGLIHVSTMVRTHETAAPLAQALGLAPVESAGIREISSGDLEMRGDRPAVTEYLETMIRWVDGEDGLRLAGGETGREFAARFDAVVAEAAASGHGTVALVSHGAAIRSWTGLRARGLDAAFVADHPLENTGVVILVGSGTDWVLESWEGEPATGVGADAPSGPTGDPAP